LVLFTVVFCAQNSPLLAAGESGWGWLEPIGRWFNLIVLVGVILYFVRKPAQKFFAERRAGIQSEMQKAAKTREAVEEKLAEMDRRLADLDSELLAIREEAKKEADLDRQRLLKEAEQEAQKIVDHARSEIEGMSRTASKDLKRYAAELALEMAEEKLRRKVDTSRNEQMAERFLNRLEVGKRGQS